MVQAVSTVSQGFCSKVSDLASYLCGPRPKQVTKPGVLVLDREGMRGPPTHEVSRVIAEVQDGAFNRVKAVQMLEGFKDKPIEVEHDTWVLSGYLDPASRITGTNMKSILKEYVKDTGRIRLKTFATAAIRNVSIEDLALDLIDNLERVYEDVFSELITINIVSHSMGSAIAMTALGMLKNMHTVKKYVVNHFISLNGAILGSPLAKISSPLRLCCRKNPAFDLRPYDRRKALVTLDVIKATFISSAKDRVIPSVNAAPPGYPVVVVKDIRCLNTHTGILWYPVAHAYILQSISRK